MKEKAQSCFTSHTEPALGAHGLPHGDDAFVNLLGLHLFVI